MASIWSEARWDEKLGRRKAPETAEPIEPAALPDLNAPDIGDWRSVFQQDYDRLLFSTPVRRLSDKTQVWPMDENDGVRTRLTHSHEVANLARSIGSRVHRRRPGIFKDADLYDTVQPILSAIGLAHDLGNPPFGHQGEEAISAWFDRRKHWIFTHHGPDDGAQPLEEPVAAEHRDDFLRFDGNPQTLRLVSKLQTSISKVGLNLTAATLAASLKYPIGAPLRDPDHPIRKKFGYFQSEAPLVEWIREATGLEEGQRHPLTWIMEACDDIAYSVLDVDDIMKKGIVSPIDVVSILASSKDLGKDAKAAIKKSIEGIDLSRSPEVVNDIRIGRLRAHVMSQLIAEAADAYLGNADEINGFSHQAPLMDGSSLCDALKGVARRYAFSNTAVLKMEAEGAAAIDGLMSFFWEAISMRKTFPDIESKRISARSKFGYAMISANYIEAAASDVGAPDEGMKRYNELRLLTDMVSGMTDTFAIRLWEKVCQVPDVCSI